MARPRDAALAADPHQRRSCGRISADRLQQSKQPDRSSDQQGRHDWHERVNQPGRSCRQIRPPVRVRRTAAVIMVTRGSNACVRQPSRPAPLKVFSFQDGVLTNLAAIPARRRHAIRAAASSASHRAQPWVYVSIESQNSSINASAIRVGSLARSDLRKETARSQTKLRQAAGTIHVHPNGRFVYLANRAWWLKEVDGKQVFPGGELDRRIRD